VQLVMEAFEFLRWMRDSKRVPYSCEKPGTYPPSSSELSRWLEKGNVIVDGARVKRGDSIVFPVGDVVFFPRASRRTTMPGFECES
jgi:hypothetical protein